MKKFLLISLFALLITSCAGVTPAPSLKPPAPVETVTTSIPATEISTATPIPETAEQRGARLAQVVNWNPNDETAWGIPSGLSAEDVKFLQEMQAINADPNTKTKEQLVAYDVFLTDMRKADMTKRLFGADAQVKESAATALRDFLSSGFLTNAPAAEAINAMLQDQAKFTEWFNTLSPEDMSNLVMVWCAENKVAFMPTHEEQKAWVKDFSTAVQNGLIIYSANVDSKNNVIGSGYYGLWPSKFDGARNVHREFDFTISLFGEEIIWRGDWGGSDYHIMDYGAKLNLPYGRTGILGLLKDPNGVVHKMPFVVTTEYIQPYYISNVGGVVSRLDLNINVFTRIFLGPGSNTLLTENYLTDNLGWPPKILILAPPNEHIADASGNNVYNMLFDPLTNLPMAADSDGSAGSLDRAGIEIKTAFNTWP